MGLDLHSVYVEPVLPEPTLDAGMLLGASADWPGYSYVANSFRSVIPLLEQYGIATAEEVDVETIPQRVRAEIVGGQAGRDHSAAYRGLGAGNVENQ